MTRADFEDADLLARREAELAAVLRPAGSMYTGDQHVRAMAGVASLRRVLGVDAVTTLIVSAGYGVLPEDRLIAPYDITFSTMTSVQARSWARARDIPRGLRAGIASADLVFVLLGSKYLNAIDPPLEAARGQRIVHFAAASDESTVRGRGIVTVPAGPSECPRYGAGLVALKGRMLQILGHAVESHGAAVLDEIHADPTPRSVLHWLGSP